MNTFLVGILIGVILMNISWYLYFKHYHMLDKKRLFKFRPEIFKIIEDGKQNG